MAGDDFLEPDVQPDGERTVEELDDEAAEARRPDDDGLHGEEHLGLTPPGLIRSGTSFSRSRSGGAG